MNTYGRTGVVLASGKGARLRSVDGREFVDFTAGIGVNVLGHDDPELVAAISAQAAKLIHVSNYFQTEPAIEASSLLCAAAGMDSVFFCNSGGEANEGAIKIARKRGNSLKPARNVIVTLLRSFHGRTVTDLAATGQERFHRDFGPFTEGFRYVEPGDKAALDRALGPDVCGFLFEAIQGEGGVFPLGSDYLKYAEKLCRERGILFMADEVQCGVGRSGAFLAAQLADVHPDVVSMAKGLAGGVPIGAVLARGEAATVLVPGDHGSTFGGNPLAAAAACVVLRRVTSPEFLREVSRKGALIMDTIDSWKNPLVQELRGRGLMIGATLSCDPQVVENAALAEGLLVLTAGANTLRLLPPLVISDEDIAEGLRRLKLALDRSAAGRR